MLSDIALLLPNMESNTHLHAFIFNAQRLGVISTSYKFDYSMNIPFSEDLEKELFHLEKGYSRDADSPKDLSNNGDMGEALLKLAGLNTRELVNLSRILYLKEMFPELSNDEQLREKARKTFFLTSDKAVRFINFMKDVKSDAVGLTPVGGV